MKEYAEFYKNRYEKQYTKLPRMVSWIYGVVTFLDCVAAWLYLYFSASTIIEAIELYLAENNFELMMSIYAIAALIMIGVYALIGIVPAVLLRFLTQTAISARITQTELLKQITQQQQPENNFDKR